MPPLDWGSSAIRIYAAYWTLPTAYLGRFYFFFLRFTPSTFFNILREKIEFVYFINLFSDCKKKRGCTLREKECKQKFLHSYPNNCITIHVFLRKKISCLIHSLSFSLHFHLLFSLEFSSFFYYITYHIHYFFSLFFFFLCFSYLHPYLCRYIIVL